MRKFSINSFNITEAINELMHDSGVIVIENAYNLNDIKGAREIVNHFADTQEQKETHFNAEAEASDKIKLQQRIWNLFGIGEVFSKLISCLFYTSDAAEDMHCLDLAGRRIFI